MTTGQPLTGSPVPVSVFTRPSVVRDWLREAGIRPNRLLGQNFLIDGNILRLLLDTAEVSHTDRILEVGPGLGALTAGLLDRGAHVVAVEKDERLLPLLEAHLAGYPHATFIRGDALALVPELLEQEHFSKMVANLPYTPGTRILVDIATSHLRPQRITVMVQDEVAGRITAEPGTTAFGLLSLWCRVFYDVSYVKRVSPNCFWPRPQIQSAIVCLARLPASLVPQEGWPFFMRFTKQLFQHRRKQVGHLLGDCHFADSLRGADCLDLLPEQHRKLRPEALPLDVWCALSENIRMQLPENKNHALMTGESDGR